MSRKEELIVTFSLMSIVTLMILVGSSLMLSIFSSKSGIGNYYRWEVCLRSGNEIGYTNADDNGHKGCITSNTNMTAVVKQECSFDIKDEQTFLDGMWVNNTDIVDAPESCYGLSKHYNGQWFDQSGAQELRSEILDTDIILQWNTDVCDWLPKGQVPDPISADLTNIIIPTFGKSVYDTLISSIVLNGLAFIITTFLVYQELSGQVTVHRRRGFSGIYAYWPFFWVFLFIIAIVDIIIFANIFTHLQPSDVDIANNIFYTPFRLDILSAVIFSLGSVFIAWTIIRCIMNLCDSVDDY